MSALICYFLPKYKNDGNLTQKLCKISKCKAAFVKSFRDSGNRDILYLFVLVCSHCIFSYCMSFKKIANKNSIFPEILQMKYEFFFSYKRKKILGVFRQFAACTFYFFLKHFYFYFFRVQFSFCSCFCLRFYFKYVSISLNIYDS